MALDNGAPVTADTHYTVTHDAATNTVTVDFTEGGRQVLAENYTAEVVVSLAPTVQGVGEIENEALVYPNRPSFDIEPGEPGGPTVTPPTVTKWGEFTLQKTDEDSRALTGAEFSVFTSEADALVGTNPVELGGQTVFGVDADGRLTLSGLRYSDWEDGAEIAREADHQTYWLVETTAPEGYELLAAPIEFEVTAATTADGVDLDVQNVPSNAGFELPMTGGNGTALLYGAGLLLVGGAVLMAVRSRRQAAAQSASQGSDQL